MFKSPPFDDDPKPKLEREDEETPSSSDPPPPPPPAATTTADIAATATGPEEELPPPPPPPPPKSTPRKARRRRHSSASGLSRTPTGARGHLASQPGLDPEALSDMSVRGLDLLRYSQISEDGSYRCLECEKAEILKSFKNKYSFQRHAFLYHEGTQRKVFPCPVCGKEFSRPDKMKQHLRQVHDCVIPKSEGGLDDGEGGVVAAASPGHFLLNPFLGPEDYHHHHAGAGGGCLIEGKLGSLQEATGSEVFKLMSRLAGHGGHMSSPGGQGAS